MTEVAQDVSREGGYANRFGAGAVSATNYTLTSQPMLIGSFPKVGKSRLFGDNPDALILNFDGVEFDPRTRAGIWPIRQGDNYYETNASGLKQIKAPTFKEFQNIHKELVGMAQRNDPGRPKMVVLDTITAMDPLVQEQMVRDSTTKSSFKEMGQDGWAERNRIIERYGRELYQAGYGVVYLVHITSQNVPVMSGTTGQIANVKEYKPTVSPGLWQSLQVQPRIVASVELKIVRVPEGGKTVSKTQRVLRISKSLLNNETQGTFVPLPEEIVLDEAHPWTSFQEAFDEATK